MKMGKKVKNRTEGRKGYSKERKEVNKEERKEKAWNK